MANRNSKKCHKPSPTSSIGSTSASKQRSNKQKPPDILKLEDSNQDPIPTGEDNPASVSTHTSKGHQLTNEQSLAKATLVHKNQSSPTYGYFDPPHISDAKDKMAAT
ncbi:hypothetical protein Pst134EB_004365 [Puccinia striiformis f. sp. tritici]|nr:hypothetical protein Pst134EB_004365 [Puccinia striiformis f. sp. tritici]